MRLMLIFEPKEHVKYSDIDKYDVQGFIYSLLKNNDLFNNLHNLNGFKFFNFSNIFPICDFDKNTLKKLIISSPNPDFIRSLYAELDKISTFRLNKYEMEILKIKVLHDKKVSKFISSTPVVLFENNLENRYYSFKQNPDFDFFFTRLKDNAIKKYNAFYDDDFKLEYDLFSGFEFVREVSVRVKKDGNSFIIIGSLWKDLEFNLTSENKRFYNFLFDAGIGEKNSLGFGFLNRGK